MLHSSANSLVSWSDWRSEIQHHNLTTWFGRHSILRAMSQFITIPHCSVNNCHDRHYWKFLLNVDDHIIKRSNKNTFIIFSINTQILEIVKIQRIWWKLDELMRRKVNNGNTWTCWPQCRNNSVFDSFRWTRLSHTAVGGHIVVHVQSSVSSHINQKVATIFETSVSSLENFSQNFNKWNSLITQAYRIRSGSFVSAHLHDTLRFVPWTSPSSCNENTTALAWYWAIAHKWATPVHLPENIWSNHSWLISVLWEWQPRSS